ncbi:unnamed protein product, partial [Discosporangium mesarthrocarpum]
RFTARRRRWKWLLYQHTKLEAFHAKQAVFRAWFFATARRWQKEADSLTLSASLPFGTWDNFIRRYLDKRNVPSDQLHKDITSNSLLQQKTSWWMLGDSTNTSPNPNPGTVAGAAGSSSDGGGGLGLGRNLEGVGEGRKGNTPQVSSLSTSSKNPKPSMDTQELTAALFKAVDACDAMEAMKLLRQGAHVNAVYIPPEDDKARLTRGGSTSSAAAGKRQRENKESKGDGLGLLAPVLVRQPDGGIEIRGTTPLHSVAAHLSADYIPMLVLLLHNGADVSALDAWGRTPVQVTPSPQVAALLAEHERRLKAQHYSKLELIWGQEV